MSAPTVRTPAEHKAVAQSMLAEAERPGRINGSVDYPMMQAHAVLARCTGKGSHYAAADALLDVDGSKHYDSERYARALVHALLADR